MGEHLVYRYVTISTSRLINIGIAQGSALGPLLCILRINDLVNDSEFLGSFCMRMTRAPQ